MPDVTRRHGPPLWVLSLVTLFLFVVWSNSFVAMSFLLGAEKAAQRLDWVELTVARFVTAGTVAGAYCFVGHRRACLHVLRTYPLRLLSCALLVVPTYNLALYYAEEHGVSPPIASLTTALVPLFVMVLSALFLAEPLTRRRLAGLAIAFAGMLLIATARGSLSTGYPWLIALTAVAPVCWSLYSVISKPVTAHVPPLLWSYLTLALGALFVLPGLPHAWPRLRALDGAGIAAVLYLALPCAVLGNALWTWLLRNLPASTVGFSVFLNPPLTTLSKWCLALFLPSVFAFSVVGREVAGAGVCLLGMWIALSRWSLSWPP